MERAPAYRGQKPFYTRTQFNTVRDMLVQAAAVGSIARQTVYRIQNDPAEAERALAA